MEESTRSVESTREDESAEKVKEKPTDIELKEKRKSRCKLVKHGLIGDTPIIEIIYFVSSIMIAFFTLTIYQKQLKIDEFDKGPQFVVSKESGVPGSNEQLVDTYEEYLRISNNGGTIQNKNIETIAVLTVAATKNEETDTYIENQYILKDYFDTMRDELEFKNVNVGIISERSTDFSYWQIVSDVYNTGVDLNKFFENTTFQVYSKFDYFTKITYTDYKGKEVSQYFKNETSINGNEYKKNLKLDSLSAKFIDRDERMDKIKSDLSELYTD